MHSGITGSIPAQGLNEYPYLSIGLQLEILQWTGFLSKELYQISRENIIAQISYKTKRCLEHSYDKETATGLTILESVTGFQHCTKKKKKTFAVSWCNVMNIAY